MQDIASRIDELRKLLKQHGIHAWVALTADPHCSEYLPGHWQTAQWLSGFTGSNATLVITRTDARLWTDSRYWIQAQAELTGSGISLMEDGRPSVTGWKEWLADALFPGATVGIDPRCCPAKVMNALRPILEAKDIRLEQGLDLPGDMWTSRPVLPASTVFDLNACQRSRGQKLSGLRAAMASRGADAFACSSLDEISWLTNLRGSDIAYTPVFLSHMLVTGNSARLYVREGAVPAGIAQKLATDGFELRPYDAFEKELCALSPETRLLADPAALSSAALIGLPCRTIEDLSPLAIMKTRKSPEEIKGIDEAMLEDGAALCRFYAWLERILESGLPVTETAVSARLHRERAKSSAYISESFETIAAVGPNAALPHYSPSEAHDSRLEGDTVLLLDSGAHYQTGTTDITRMTPIHRPPEPLMRDYTAVLRGHLHLLSAHFPEGTYASQLDSFARAPIWEIDADYGHGTGHGVGFALTVHERPFSISPKSKPSEGTRTVPGIVVSDEPGIYREGRWGIRIESLITPEPVSGGEFGRFLAFRPLTLCPIDTRLIIARMMTSEEIATLNRYHHLVREKLKPRVTGDALDWLMRRTEIF